MCKCTFLWTIHFIAKNILELARQNNSGKLAKYVSKPKLHPIKYWETKLTDFLEDFTIAYNLRSSLYKNLKISHARLEQKENRILPVLIFSHNYPSIKIIKICPIVETLMSS